jgi:hypothetical protein
MTRVIGIGTLPPLCLSLGMISFTQASSQYGLAQSQTPRAITNTPRGNSNGFGRVLE